MNQKEIEAAGREEYALWRNSKDRVNSIYDFMASNANAHIDRLDKAVTSGDPEDMLDVFGPGGGIAGLTKKTFQYVGKKNPFKQNSSESKEWAKNSNRERARNRYVDNTETIKKQAVEWRKNNLDRARQIQSNYDKTPAGKAKSARTAKNYRSTEKGKSVVNANSQKYQAGKINRTPSWLTTKDLEEIKSFYQLSTDLQQATGKKMNVDHVIPLQGKKVTGLHVPNNLQVLEKNENVSKLNRINLDDIEKLGREAYERTVQQREWIKILKAQGEI